MGRAISLRPDMPDPVAIEFADVLAGKSDAKKHAKVVSLASKLLKSRRS
jgi:hypothetical protein